MSQLCVFDVEGVFLPRKRVMILEVSHRLSLTKTIRIIFYVMLYWLRLINVTNLLLKSYRVFRGTPFKKFYEIYQNLPSMKNTEKAVAELKKHGFVVVLISSGLPRQVVEDLRDKNGADFAYGVEVEVDRNGLMTGKVSGDVMDPHGKRKIVESVCSRLKIQRDNVVAVADDRNNLQLLDVSGLFIGFNPDVEVSSKVEHTIHSVDLHQVAKAILKQPVENNFFTHKFLFRKLIHLLGVSTIFIAMIFGLTLTQILIASTYMLFLLSEYLRLSGKRLPLFSSVTRFAASEEEQLSPILDPIWFAAGIFLTLSIFPLEFAAVGIVTLTIGDVVAGIVGRKIRSRHIYPFNKAKSVEGTAVGFISAALLCSLLVDPRIAVVGCFVGMVIEALPHPMSDNIAIPVLSSLTVFLLFSVF